MANLIKKGYQEMNMLPKYLKKSIKEMTYLAKGSRGIIYTGIYKNKKVAIKTKSPESEAIGRLKNESEFLKLLNKHNIGPTLLNSGKEYIIYEFVEGEFLPEFLIKEKDKKKKKKILINILKQARKLDKLRINKLEFTRPLKHVLIKYPKVKILDFERCYYTESPKNVTQFCQFLINRKLMKKEIKILQQYKENQTEKNFKEIIKKIN
ncbi:protein kinase [archaeon]|jgi:putative serine/threonine protein kinase|nr:protein kinase [archaeon]MBT6824164.1 protein kinase [archaeon]MBT7106992.1 protein kinase [archaeon]MBT7297604.1 protein kinase [archaeon]